MVITSVVRIYERKSPLYFEGHLDFFAPLQNLCVFTISRRIPNDILWIPGWETLV